MQLVELFARVFAKPITLEHWRWKLRQQPSPTESIWLGVVDTEGDGGAPHTPHETPIFQYAGIPTPYSLDGKTATNMTLVDIMTAPEARRQGLLTQIGQSVNDHWRRAGVPFVIGLPNDQWGSRMAALGCEPLFPLQWLVRPLRPMNVLFRRLHIPAPSFAPVDSIWNGFRNRRVKPDTGVRIRLVQKAGPEFDTVWRLCEDDAAFSVVRDSRWVQWRYLDSPSMDYQVALAERASDPVGYAAYRTVHAGGRRVGFLSELTVPYQDTGAAGTLIVEVTKQLYQGGAEVAATLAVPGTPLYDAWRKAGFIPAWGAFTVRVIPLSEYPPLERLCKPENWRISGGDFDVI